MTFRIGQKVVCIKQGSWTALSLGEVGPSYGDVLTIRRIDDDAGETYFRFTEIMNPQDGSVDKNGNYSEARFWSARFRPVVERKTKTGMAILREILDRESHQDKPPVKHKSLTPNQDALTRRVDS
jgi:hypothetical protein